MKGDLVTALCALYLSGGPSVPRVLVPRQRWTEVVGALRTLGGCPLAALAAAGLRAEAGVAASRWDWAQRQVESGSVLTPLCPGYPALWRDRLGDSAPPALWRLGPRVPGGPAASVVGSRDLTGSEQDFATSAGVALARLGYWTCSGGARGADRLAMHAALEAGGPGCELRPMGLGSRLEVPEGAGAFNLTLLSASDPADPFTTSAAMERNRWIYAAGEFTIVVAAQFKFGGTWHGAVSCLRDRLAPVLVRVGETSPDHARAARVLVALGAFPIGDADLRDLDRLREVTSEACTRGHSGRLFGASSSLWS